MAIVKIKVIIADDHDVYRDGLRLLLETDEEIEVTGEAADGRELVELVRERHPDIVLTDIMMPGTDGIQAIKEMKAFGFERCITLSTYQSDSLIVEALEAGAKGYIHKNAQKAEIIEAVKTVRHSGHYYCKSTSSRLATMIGGSKFNPYTNSIPPLFSEEEKEIIRHICRGRTSEEIANIMCLGKRNVERARMTILNKMNEKTATGIVIYAIKNSIFDVNDDRDLSH